MPRRTRRTRQNEPPHEPEPSVNVVPEPDEDADLAAILEESKKDYERAEKVRKQEDEELQKAINASLMSAPSTSSSTSQANDESMSKNEAEAINETAEVFYDAVENVDDDSNAMVPESSGLSQNFQLTIDPCPPVEDNSNNIAGPSTSAENSYEDGNGGISTSTPMKKCDAVENVDDDNNAMVPESSGLTTTSSGRVRGRGKGRGRGRGRSRGRGRGRANARLAVGAAANISGPSTSTKNGYEDGSGVVSSSTPMKKCDASDNSEGEDDDAADETFDVSTHEALEEFAHSFTEAVTLSTIARIEAPNSSFQELFEELDVDFDMKIAADTRIQSIVTGRNYELQQKYQQRRESFQVLGLPQEEKILYYNGYSGTSRNVLWNIIKKHVNPFKNHGGKDKNIYGKGLYLHINPDIAKANNMGVVACRVLVGSVFKSRKPDNEDVPSGHHSKFVQITNANKFYVVPNPDQILPLAVIHCARDAPTSTLASGSNNEGMNEDQVRQFNEQMARLFENSLKLHLTGQYMRPCKAIKTYLYPHQMYALAWMRNRENKRCGMEVGGGILADDMGLGKTLTVLSLILSNFHESRPLARPVFGFQREPSRGVMKYMPRGIAEEYKNEKRPRKDLNGKIKGSKRKYSNGNRINEALVRENDFETMELDPEAEKDEFDDLCNANTSLTGKLGLNNSGGLDGLFGTKRRKFFDDLSDDEDYQNMTEAERNEKMAPQLNLDGNITDDLNDSSDDEIVSSTTNKKSRRAILEDSDEEDVKPVISRAPSALSGLSDDLPDLETSFHGDDDQEINNEDTEVKGTHGMEDQLTEEQRKNLIQPRDNPPSLKARQKLRRSTLIVTPASLISHWLEQIERHVERSVDLSIFVHHGQNKAMISTELEEHDIVFTTYGTMQTELDKMGPGKMGPLLKAKWLRVVLDEGHLIKNHLSKTARAAEVLDTKRKWIISGTPIQNNLHELWCLLKWLQEDKYGVLPKYHFKNEIEHPVKHGSMRGIIRLQTLIESVCLRRTKQDEINGKPLVELPKKNVQVKELDFTDEERKVYDAYHAKAGEIVEKYLRKKTLMKNYAHVFAIMMRLRQLCCHRELLPIDWREVDMEELAALASAEEAEMSDEDAERAKQMAERLRDMIKDGISDECSVCLSEFDHPVITPCAHIYCRACITQHIEATENPPAMCPLCRGPLEIRTLLEAAHDENSEEEGADKVHEDIKIDVSSTKVNACLTELARIRQNPETKNDKTIIVSQFTSFLSIIQPLLKEQGYKFNRLDGTMSMRQRAEVISDFQDTDPEKPTVMLLSLRAGGVGLNLNVANHLLLLDPAWNPSTEDQCFDRIHRLGQKKDVNIIRFIMKNSIENKMLDIQEKKKHLISGAFRQTEHERRQQRIQDIRDIFGL